MSMKINKNGKEYPLGFMPEHYPASNVSLSGGGNVEDKLASIETNISGIESNISKTKVTILNINNNSSCNINLPDTGNEFGGCIYLVTYFGGVNLNSFIIPFRASGIIGASVGKVVGSTDIFTVSSASVSNRVLHIEFSRDITVFGYAIAYSLSN